MDYGESNPGVLNAEIFSRFAQSPLLFIVNGNFWVMVFCIISGYLVYNKVLISNSEQISKLLFKRYLRPFLPLFIVCLLIFLIYRMNLFNYEELATAIQSSWLMAGPGPKLIDLLLTPINILFTQSSNVFSNAFWMLKDLFFGYFVSVILAIMMKQIRHYKKTILLLISIALLFNGLLSCFAFGPLLAQMNIEKEETKENSLKFIIIFLISIILAGYPTGVTPSNLYKLIDINVFLPINSAQTIHIIASFLMLLSINHLSMVKKHLLQSHY